MTQKLEKFLFYVSVTNASIVLIDHLWRKFEVYKSFAAKRNSPFGFGSNGKNR